MTFYEKFLSLCNQKGVKPHQVTKEIGMSNATATDWKNGSLPRDLAKRKLADYFDVSVGYFDNNEKSPTAENGEGLTEQEKHLLKLFRSTDDEGVKAKVIVRVEETISEAERKALKPDSSAVG